jgi:hypothetical protein
LQARGSPTGKGCTRSCNPKPSESKLVMKALIEIVMDDPRIIGQEKEPGMK